MESRVWRKRSLMSRMEVLFPIVHKRTTAITSGMHQMPCWMKPWFASYVSKESCAIFNVNCVSCGCGSTLILATSNRETGQKSFWLGWLKGSSRRKLRWFLSSWRRELWGGKERNISFSLSQLFRCKVRQDQIELYCLFVLRLLIFFMFDLIQKVWCVTVFSCSSRH